jgi:hypothetical protein
MPRVFAYPSGARPGHRLEPERLIETARNLADDINDRLSGSSLAELSRELVKLAVATAERGKYASRPIYFVRGFSALAIAMGFAAIGLLVSHVHSRWSLGSIGDLVMAISAGANLAILSAGAFWSCLTLEARIKRAAALGFLEELREFIQVVDVTQLYYTPDLYRSRIGSGPPRRAIDETYLLYCTQMLAVISTLAPLYTRGVTGDSILRAAAEVEMLAIAITTKHLAKAEAVRRISARGTDTPRDG